MEHERLVATVRAALDAACLRAPVRTFTGKDREFAQALAEAQAALDEISRILAVKG